MVYVSGDIAFIVETHLKVMLESDYLALKENLNKKEIGTDQLEVADVEKLNDVSSSIIREIIIPEIEKEVNEGENFANLRQIFYSMVLATWFKRNLKESLLGKVYVEQNKVNGIDVEDKTVKEKIYQQYLEAFRVGVYDYIKEDYDQRTQQVVPRKYFSGGYVHNPEAVREQNVSKVSLGMAISEEIDGNSVIVKAFLDPFRNLDELYNILDRIAERDEPEFKALPKDGFGCKFCASGIDGWKRNLTTAEILTQILHVKEEANKHKKPLSHIVCMGTGESFDNYENLLKALRVVNDEKGINIGARRITISTVGLIPKIMQFAEENFQVELAISLHGYNDESRNKLMPVNRKYPFTDLMSACREYIKKTHRQVTFEYILIKDITCTEEAAKELAKNLKGMICKLNLIPYNPVQEFPHKPPTHDEMRAFKCKLDALGIHATLRAPRGRDIAAACGQLRHTNQVPKTE